MEGVTDNVENVNGDEKSDISTFNIKYLGIINIDRRYQPNVFPWVARELIKKNEPKNVIVTISSSELFVADDETSKEMIEQHSLDSIYRLSRLRQMETFLAYLTTGLSDTSPCLFHLFDCGTADNVSVFSISSL